MNKGKWENVYICLLWLVIALYIFLLPWPMETGQITSQYYTYTPGIKPIRALVIIHLIHLQKYIRTDLFKKFFKTSFQIRGPQLFLKPCVNSNFCIQYRRPNSRKLRGLIQIFLTKYNRVFCFFPILCHTKRKPRAGKYCAHASVYCIVQTL